MSETRLDRLEKAIDKTEKNAEQTDKIVQQILLSTERMVMLQQSQQDSLKRMQQFSEKTEQQIQDMQKTVHEFMLSSQKRHDDTDGRIDVLEARLHLPMKMIIGMASVILIGFLSAVVAIVYNSN